MLMHKDTFSSFVLLPLLREQREQRMQPNGIQVNVQRQGRNYMLRACACTHWQFIPLCHFQPHNLAPVAGIVVIFARFVHTRTS
jgi:hypothetical protein